MAKIFFDLDGPILDNREKYYKLYRDLTGHLDVRILSPDEYWSQKREKIPEQKILSFFSAADFKNYEEKRLQLIESREYLAHDLLQPQIKNILTQWSKEHELFLVTMRKNRSNLLHQLEALRLLSFFKKIFNEDANSGEWQVKTNLIKEECSGHCIIIGDTEADISAGKSLNIKTVALTCGIRSKEFLFSQQPDFVFEDTRSIPLEKILSE